MLSADHYQRKLWHQLTVAIEESLKLPDFKTPDVLIPFYTEFVSGFAYKLNPLRLAHIAVSVAEQYKDPKDAGWHLHSCYACLCKTVRLTALQGAR